MTRLKWIRPLLSIWTASATARQSANASDVPYPWQKQLATEMSKTLLLKAAA